MDIGDRDGFALPAALGALVIIGVLITAGFFMAQQELRIGVASKHANMAVNIAQAGANEILANWNGYELGSIPLWSDTTISGTLERGDWEVTIHNANNFVYMLTATGQVTEGGPRWAGAKRTIGIATKMIFADIEPPAALTTRGAVTLSGGAYVDGTDTDPPGWSPYCDGFAANDTTGVLSNDTSAISTVGASDIYGSPEYDQDSTIVDSTFTTFGNMDWAELSALAQAEGKDVTSLGGTITVIEPALTGSGECDEAVLTNWGDTIPTEPCGSYFPLVYHGGSVTMQSGGFGQGILLVEGDLELRGNFLFYGIIVVQGEFQTQGSGNRIVGAVMASNSNIDNQSVTGSSAVTYSSCAIQRAILNNASLSRARPVMERSWIDLTSVAN
ncbi:MAG: hypothetical protein R3304_03855 [Longimicrobiales bacterium]|nr:hypothetical protein [Longimicrobiales bacterium]